MKSLPLQEDHFKTVGVYLGGGRLRSGEFKAHAVFGGVPTGTHVINILNQTSEVDRIVAIVPNKDFLEPQMEELQKPIIFIEAHEKFGDNILAAFNAVSSDEDVVILFSDVPFVRQKSVSKLLSGLKNYQVVVPAIFKEDLQDISNMHNIHFFASKDGYFQLGNAVLLRKGCKHLIDLTRFEKSYSGRSYRINLKAKFRLAYEYGGIETFIVALRHLISANLQHSRIINLDKLIPSPKIETYRGIISKIIGIPCGLLFGNFGDLFIDFDYPEDTSLLKKNKKEIDSFISKHVK